MRGWIEFIWLRILTTVTGFGVAKMQWICWLDERILASYERLCSMELINVRYNPDYGYSSWSCTALIRDVALMEAGNIIMNLHVLVFTSLKINRRLYTVGFRTHRVHLEQHVLCAPACVEYDETRVVYAAVNQTGRVESIRNYEG
jgi:hypothetical protein